MTTMDQSLEATDERVGHGEIDGVSVVIPAFNEEGAVADEVDKLRRVMDGTGLPFEIVVVDDGSADRTAERAREAGARVLRQPENRGYGAALKLGIRNARFETVVITDADGTYPADAIPAMLEVAPEFDMVVGARTGDDVNIPLVRRPAKWFLRVLAGFLAERPIPDLNSGLRVLRRRTVARFDAVLPSGFSFTTTITLAMLCNDYRVRYHPINYARRVGQSKIRPAHAYHFLLLILRTIVYFNPLKVFLPVGAVLFVAATAKFVYDVTLENLSESAVLGFLGAVIVWAIGLLSDQIAKINAGSWRS